MLIVSVGTGGAAKAKPELRAGDMHLLYNVSTLPGALMNAAGEPPNWSGPKLFAYSRYDTDVTPAGLAALGLPDIDAQAMQEMDSVKSMSDIQRVGKAFAERHVSIDQLRGFC